MEGPRTRAAFLSLSIHGAGVGASPSLGWEGCPVCGAVLSSLSGLHPPEARSSP